MSMKWQRSAPHTSCKRANQPFARVAVARAVIVPLLLAGEGNVTAVLRRMVGG